MPYCSLKYFTQILNVIEQFGVPKTASLSAIGLTQIPDMNRLDSDLAAGILTHAAKELDDPLIGIKCAFRYPILQYSRPAELLKICADLAQATEIYKIYSPLFHAIGRSSAVLSENGIDRIKWEPNFSADSVDNYRQIVEFIVTNFVTTVNWLVWQIPDSIDRVNLKHDATLPLHAYQELFKCEVKFGQAEYSMILKPGVKHAPFSFFDPVQLANYRRSLDAALNTLEEDENLIDRLEREMRRMLGYEKITKPKLAATLGFSTRTLARELANRGTNFKDVKLRVLQETAISKIKENIPLVTIAHALGYNDQPAFTRAFKSWFGVPPSEYNSGNK